MSHHRLADRISELEGALRPFALWADSMYALKDDQKVCGIYVRHFRDAAKVINGPDCSAASGSPSTKET